MMVRVVGKPVGVDLDDVVVTSSAKPDAILVFVKRSPMSTRGAGRS